MFIEGSVSRKNLVVSDIDNPQSKSLDKYKEEIKKLHMEINWLKEKNIGAPEPGNFVCSENKIMQTEDKVIEIHEDKAAISYPVDATLDVIHNKDAQLAAIQTLHEYADKHEHTLNTLVNPANANSTFENIEKCLWTKCSEARRR